MKVVQSAGPDIILMGDSNEKTIETVKFEKVQRFLGLKSYIDYSGGFGVSPRIFRVDVLRSPTEECLAYTPWIAPDPPSIILAPTPPHLVYGVFAGIWLLISAIAICLIWFLVLPRIRRYIALLKTRYQNKIKAKSRAKTIAGEAKVA